MVGMGVKVKIKTEKDKILLCDDNGVSCMLMQKPEIEDYNNLSKKTLVVNYHMEEETIWTRFCGIESALQETCGDSAYFACYSMLFAELYDVFVKNSQMKNIICYGMEETDGSAALFQNFTEFTQHGSSFITIPANPFALSAVLNKSCQAAVVCTDVCDELRTVCDVAGKIKRGGRLFLYTKNGDIPAAFSTLPGLSEKRAFGSSSVWSVSAGDALLDFVEENDSESAMLPSLNRVIYNFEELENFIPVMESHEEAPPEAYLRAAELLWEMEDAMLGVYAYLDNPELPILAALLRESVMDCYIGCFMWGEKKHYFERLRQNAESFREAVRTEFK